MSVFNRLLPQRSSALTVIDRPVGAGAAESRFIDSSNFVPPPGSMADGAGQHWAMSNLAVFACVRVLADTIAAMPWYVYKRDADNLPVRVHPSPLLMRRPAMPVDLFQWKWMVVASLCLRGNSYHLVVGRDKTGWPTGLMPLHPDMVSVELRPPSVVMDWYDPVYRVAGEKIPTVDMVHIRRFMMPGEPVGLTPIGMAQRAIDMGLSAEEYGRRYFHESANPSSTLSTEQNLSEDEVIRNQKQWIASHGGRRRPAVLTGGFKWTPISLKPDESQFLETRRFQRGEIAMMYGVPPHMIGDTEKSTSWGSGIEQQSIGFTTFSLQAWLTCIESSLSALLPGGSTGGQFVRFDTNSLLRSDRKARYEAYNLARNAGWANVNEIRREEEMPPIGPDGDVYLQPVNYAPLGYDPAAAGLAAAQAHAKTLVEGQKQPAAEPDDDESDDKTPTNGQSPNGKVKTPVPAK